MAQVDHDWTDGVKPDVKISTFDYGMTVFLIGLLIISIVLPIF